MKITVSKTLAELTDFEQLTSGMIGKTIEAEFSDEWVGLTKVAVFSNGETSIDVINPSGTIVIPWEVLAVPNKTVFAGFYGYTVEKGEKVLAIPTIYAELGRVRKGTDPSNDSSTLPSPTTSEQLQDAVNSLEQRMASITFSGGEGGAVASVNGQIGNVVLTAEDIGALPNDTAIPCKTSDLQNDSGFGTYTKPAGGIPKADLEDGVRISLGKADSALQEHQSLAEYSKTSELAEVAVSGAYADLIGKPSIPTQLSQLNGDSSHRTVTDAEKARWNTGGGDTSDIEERLDEFETFAEEIMQNTYDLDRGTEIPERADLNNFTDIGVYYCSSAARAATLRNCPLTTSNFKLVVQRVGTTSYIHQTIIAGGGTARKLQRVKSDDWNSWYEIISTALTLDIANGGTGATSASDARDNLGLGAYSLLNTLPSTNITAVTQLKGDRLIPIAFSSDVQLASVTFPRYTKGIFMSTGTAVDSTAVVIAVGTDASLYTAYRNGSGTWTNAKKYT